MSPGAQARKAAVALALLLGVALCALPLSGHVDDSDAHLYTVLARHIAGGLAGQRVGTGRSALARLWCGQSGLNHQRHTQCHA